MDKQDVLDDASSFFRCDDDEDLSDIEHDLHPDDGSDEEVHSEATRPHQSACDAPALRAVAPAEETSLRSPGGDDDGDDDDGDDEGSAAYGSVEDATGEWTCRFCTSTSESTNALLCSICGTIRVERTERTDPPMRGILDEADSIEIRPIRHENDGNDEGWVLFNENRHLCYGWDISTPRGNLCYIRYIGRENEKSFEMEWRHARRKSGRVSAAVSPALLSREQEEEAAAATAKRRQSTCTRKRKAPANGKRGVKSCFGKPTHYLEDRLGKTMDEIDEFMPKAIAGNINECFWCPWKEGKCGPRVYHPVLILHPSAISGNSEALHKVKVMIREAIEKNDPEMWNKHLIFFYSAKISMRKEGPSLGHKAFALVDSDDLVPYSEGVKRGCHRPENLVSKINSGEMFSGDDEAFWLGLEQIEKDSELDKERRGGPFFFEHERQEYFDQAEKLKKERVEEWEKKRFERAGKRAERRREDQRHGFTFSNAAGVELASLELYSGEARMTAALKKNGFGNNFTLDNNPKKKSDSSLSIEQLESMIEENERHRYYHHPIRMCYDVIWAAPCCTTYSIAASKTIYRTYGTCHGLLRDLQIVRCLLIFLYAQFIYL